MLRENDASAAGRRAPRPGRRAFVAAAGMLAAMPAAVLADAPLEIRISKGYGILYLPLLVMEKQRLFEKHAASLGAGNCRVSWVLLDGGGSINDAMMAGTLDFAGTGAPGFIDLWARARGIPNVEVVGVSGLSATSLWLNANRPRIRSLRDFTAKDKIALPGIKTSLSAVVLQMMAAKILGSRHFAALDALTANYPHPAAMRALIERQDGVSAHLASPPFSYLELLHKDVHRVLSSVDVLGNIILDVIFAPRRFTQSHPLMVDVFLAALDEANRFIAAHRHAAAALYAADAAVSVSAREVLSMLDDPDTRFSLMPNQIMDYVNFLYGTGTIRIKPERWTELFVPQLVARASQ